MEDFRKVLTVWYNHNKRELPWRESKDPYKIWVSEVILQQTRVNQGMEYYFNFLAAFPDIKSLANAPEEEVLKAWQGLGYYSRARNIHHAAKTILADHGGVFPDNYQAIRNLKGIGDYTAAAISSIVFNLPHAVVDGNVYRVLARLFGITTPIDSSAGKKEVYSLAREMLDKEHPGEFNQALMEFGAIQCLPQQPLCSGCPLSIRCQAFISRSVSSFPVKSKKVSQRDRYLTYLYIESRNFLFLEKRGDRDIWRNMYQFPLIETTGPATPEEVADSAEWKNLFENVKVVGLAVYPERIHLLSHQRLHIRFMAVSTEGTQFDPGLIRVDKSAAGKYPVPKPVEVFLLEMGH